MAMMPKTVQQRETERQKLRSILKKYKKNNKGEIKARQNHKDEEKMKLDDENSVVS